MKKILAFAGSTSSTSINKQLATYAAENLENTSFDVIDLRDFAVGEYFLKITKGENTLTKSFIVAK